MQAFWLAALGNATSCRGRGQKLPGEYAALLPTIPLPYGRAADKVFSRKNFNA
jgi:hypothetical protein